MSGGKQYTVGFWVERGEEELELEVTGTCSAYVPAVTHLPPERCHPAEGGEVEILSITLNDEEWDGELTDLEMDKVEEKIFERARDDEDDYDDCVDEGDDDLIEELPEHW